jgi:hypothetical protein
VLHRPFPALVGVGVGQSWALGVAEGHLHSALEAAVVHHYLAWGEAVGLQYLALGEATRDR